MKLTAVTPARRNLITERAYVTAVLRRDPDNPADHVWLVQHGEHVMRASARGWTGHRARSARGRCGSGGGRLNLIC